LYLKLLLHHPPAYRRLKWASPKGKGEGKGLMKKVKKDKTCHGDDHGQEKEEEEREGTR
jgi:hypothetical protein